MSLGGRDYSTQNVVYGPDGTMYGTPLQARNAGVQNPTGQPPAGVPAIPYGRAATPGSDFLMQMPAPQPYTSAITPLPSIPTPASGGRNRYAEIMSQFGQSQPFSFTGMPSGGFNPYASDYTGGFTPYQRPIPAPAPPVQQDQYSEIIRQLGGGGNAGDREGPSAFSQMTPAERAAYYAANPTEAKIALGFQDLLGNATLMGQIGKYFGADGWYDSRLEKLGLDPESFAYGPPDPNFSSQGSAAARNEALQGAIAAANADTGLVANPMAQDPAQRAEAVAEAISQAVSQQDAANARDGGGGGAATGGRDTGDGARDASGGGDRGTRGGFAKGGHVSMMHLQGPDPMGPDDGYAALKMGEFVINDKAVKKYGIELMNAINSGKISKGKLRGLLEM